MFLPSLFPAVAPALGQSLAHHAVLCSAAQPCPTLCNPIDPAGLLCPQDFTDKTTGVGCHSLLQGIIPAQGSNSNIPYGSCIGSRFLFLTTRATWGAQLTLSKCEK